MNDKYDVIEYVGLAVDEQYRLERERVTRFISIH